MPEITLAVESRREYLVLVDAVSEMLDYIEAMEPEVESRDELRGYATALLAQLLAQEIAWE